MVELGVSAVNLLLCLLLVGWLFKLKKRQAAHQHEQNRLLERFELELGEVQMMLERVQERVGHIDEDIAGQVRRFNFFKEDVAEMQTVLDQLNQRLQAVMESQQTLSTIPATRPDPHESDISLLDSVHAVEVLGLFEKGLKADQIARESGIQISEVNLILGLRKFAKRG